MPETTPVLPARFQLSRSASGCRGRSAPRRSSGPTRSLLRALAALELVQDFDGDRFEPTPVGACLRADAAMSPIEAVAA